MRVLQLISQTVIGGAESFGFVLGSELANRGHDVLLLANRANGPLFEREHPRKLTLRALHRTSRLDPRMVSFLFGAVREFSPEIIHSHNFEPNTWARTLGLLFPRLKVVCHEHSGRKANQPPHRAWLDRMLFRRCSAVFAVSDELGKLLRERHRVPPEVLHVLPNGIDTLRFAPPATNVRKPKGIVCVASLTEVKNHRAILRAFRLVQAEDPAATLTLVGDGPLRQELELLASADGLQSAVRFVGTQQDVRPFLWEASIFLLFSHREAMPLSLLEAMAAGCACVAPSVGEIPAMIGRDEAGLLVPPEDEGALTAALVELLRSSDRCRSLAEEGRRRVEERYSLRACVDVIERTYTEIRR